MVRLFANSISIQWIGRGLIYRDDEESAVEQFCHYSAISNFYYNYRETCDGKTNQVSKNDQFILIDLYIFQNLQRGILERTTSISSFQNRMALIVRTLQTLDLSRMPKCINVVQTENELN